MFLTSLTLHGQHLKGKIRGSDGESIPFASIFVKESTFGTTTNDLGDYDILIPSSGTYNIIFQSLGYEKQEHTITFKPAENKTLDITLKRQDYKLKEVRVYSGNEDPAYPIMRKAIGLAPFHLRQVRHYTAEVYLKGSLLMEKLPKFIQKQIEKEGEKIEVGKRYTAESLNEISFHEPDKFNHKVISSRTSFPGNNDNSVMGYVSSSFYNSETESIISPLAPNAFSHYKFRYEGFFYDGPLTVNKIKVTPRRKSQQLVNGYFYIIENLWCLHSVDVEVEPFVGKIRIRQTYSPVKENAWLPTSHQFNVKAALFGVKADFAYAGSVKYKTVEMNKALPVPASLQAQYDQMKIRDEAENAQPAKSSKGQSKLNQLMAKEELSNRDMIRMAKLMDKESKPTSKDESLEIKRTYEFKIEKDTVKRDSTYWNSIRPIPLTNDEIKSFEIKDSLHRMAKSESDSTQKKSKKPNSNKFSSKIIDGGRFYNSDSTTILNYRGILHRENIGFNPVEGIWLKQQATLTFKLDTLHSLSLTPTAGYSFQRDVWTGTLGSGYNYHPIRRGTVGISGGRTTLDYAGNKGFTPFINSIYNLMAKENYIKLFQKDYFFIQNGIDLANGFRLNVKAEYAAFSHLSNTTNFSFYKKDTPYASNDPDNEQVNELNLAPQKEFNIHMNFTYTPRHHYRMNKGRKIMAHSKYPTFQLGVWQGVPEVLGSSSHYTRAELSISQSLEKRFSEFSYQAYAGIIDESAPIHFASFRHFATHEPIISTLGYDQRFALLPTYGYSTKENFVEAHATYTSSFLLLKYLPFFSNRMWKENLYFNYLTHKTLHNYTEAGYGLSQIFVFGQIGTFVGFENGKYRSWGLKVGLKF